ncbi:zinc finger, CCHC-type containing protein [Tanacetum coccineum]
MPYSTYMKLTDEGPTETDIRLSLASHSYIYPLGIAKDVLVEIAEHVYPVDFVILDIKEDEKRPFILGTPFLTTTKPRPLTGGQAVVNGGPPPLTGGPAVLTADDGTVFTPRGTTQVVTRGHLMIECQICSYEVQTDMSANMSDIQGGRTRHTRLYLMGRSLEVLRKFHWMILGGRFNQLSHVSSPLLSKPGEY